MSTIVGLADTLPVWEQTAAWKAFQVLKAHPYQWMDLSDLARRASVESITLHRQLAKVSGSRMSSTAPQVYARLNGSDRRELWYGTYAKVNTPQASWVPGICFLE